MLKKKYIYNEKEICELFEKGYNSMDIVEYYNMNKHNYKTIIKILKKNGYKPTGKRLKYSIQDEKNICELYKNGATQLEIWDMYKDKINTESTIHQILIKNNIKMRRTGSRSAITNHAYFSKIDTEWKAYFLGLLMADGCISKTKTEAYTTVQLGLKLEDKYLIDNFAVEIGFSKQLYIENREEKKQKRFYIIRWVLYYTICFWTNV